jgi:hypothetical protein
LELSSPVTAWAYIGVVGLRHIWRVHKINVKSVLFPTHIIISISALDGGKPLEKDTLTPNE